MQRLSITIICAAIVSAGISAPATANNEWFANGKIGERFGVHVRGLTTTVEDLDGIKTAGFGLIRWVLDWSYVEKRRGLYDWDRFDAFMKEVRARQLHSIIVVTGGNAAYSRQPETVSALRNSVLTKVAPAPKDLSAVQSSNATCASRPLLIASRKEGPSAKHETANPLSAKSADKASR